MEDSNSLVHEGVNIRLEQKIARACDAVGAFIAYWGFKAVHGRVWAMLVLRRTPMHQAEIAELLGVSRSLVSGSIAELSRYGLVRALGEHRNAPYEATLDVWSTISDVLRSREWMLVESARLALESTLEEMHIAEDLGVDVPYDQRRVEALLGMAEVAQRMLQLIIKMRSPQIPDRIGDWVASAASLLRRARSTSLS